MKIIIIIIIKRGTENNKVNMNKNIQVFENKVRKLMGLKENKKKVNGFGCVMVNVVFPEFSEIKNKIDKDDLYNDPNDDSFGLEKTPHVTLLYGIHDTVKDSEVELIINNSKLNGNVILTKVSLFENEKFDVLKFDVEKTDDLVSINEKLSKLPVTTDYPIFNPHLTICYLKPNSGDKYVNLFKDVKFELWIKNIVYSKNNGEKINFNNMCYRLGGVIFFHC